MSTERERTTPSAMTSFESPQELCDDQSAGLSLPGGNTV